MHVLYEINNLMGLTFAKIRYGMVLTLPLLFFWLILGFVLLPLASGGVITGVFFTILLLFGLIAAFSAGWMNMFKKSAETSMDANLSDDKLTYDSFDLFKEFFPGVGKYFGKMFLGVGIYFFLFNIIMLLLEITVIPVFGSFESFSQQEMVEAMKNPEKTIPFWNSISATDKSKIFTIAGLEVIVMFLFFYITMFWSQLVVLKDVYPLQAILESYKTVIKDPARTGAIFLFNFTLVTIIFFIGTLLIVNPLLKLLMILLFVYALVFYVMMTFLYLERYSENIQKQQN